MSDDVKDERNDLSRRKILSQGATTGLLAALTLSGSAAATGGSNDEDGPSVGTEMNLPAGGGGGTSYSDYSTTRDESDSRAGDTTYDFSELDNSTADGTDFSETRDVFGTEVSVSATEAAVGYKTCGGYSREMVYSSVDLEIDGSNGAASYGIWLGIDTSGCIWMGDPHGCVKLDSSGSCKVIEYSEATAEHADELFNIAMEAYTLAKERSNGTTFGDVVKAIVGFFFMLLVIALAAAAGAAGAGA